MNTSILELSPFHYSPYHTYVWNLEVLTVWQNVLCLCFYFILFLFLCLFFFFCFIIFYLLIYFFFGGGGGGGVKSSAVKIL